MRAWTERLLLLRLLRQPRANPQTMNVRHTARFFGALLMFLVLSCTGRKQVPFGLEDPETSTTEPTEEAEQGASEWLVGEVFEAGQVEVPIEESAMVLDAGYALAALRLDLDDDGVVDALVVSAGPEEVRLQAGYPRGMTVRSRTIDSFIVPGHCLEPKAEIRQLSESLVGVVVEHTCETGKRENLWVLSVEAQPRVRERITVFPPNRGSGVPIELSLRIEDHDSDGYDDVIADTRIGAMVVPLTWLNRPGGFARDTSQPEATFQQLADQAAAMLSSDVSGAEKLALEVLDAFRVLCRESGTARLGLSGTQGLQCQRSPGAARASTIAATAAIRKHDFVRALELQRWWGRSATQPTAEDRNLVNVAWQRAKAKSTATWQRLDSEAGSVPLHFLDSDTLVIGGRQPRKVQISTGTRSSLSELEALPPIRDPESRFRVDGVRVTCAGFEANVGPVRGKRTHRVPIDRTAASSPCKTPVDRPASALEWAVLGWAPQGLLAATGDRLRIVPLDAFAKPAGRPIDLAPGSPLPAPIRGPRITPDGSRYVIPHSEGIVVRDWRTGATQLWLRPSDWATVPGGVRSVAISPDGRRVAVQKGSEIRLLIW